MKNRKGNLPLTLPDDLIEQILLRSPVRSLLRFKCVCKSWFSLISNPQFAQSHFDIAAAPTHRLLMKSVNDSEVNSVDIDAPFHSNNSAKVVFNIPLPSPAPKYRCEVDIVGFCRGFVLLTNWYCVYLKFVFDFIIWNPSTGFQKRINVSRHGSLCGFVYDSSVDDYVVVTVTLRPRWCTEIRCFSLKTNSWSHISTVKYFPLGNRQGLLLNGALHWLIASYNDHRLIIVFDVRQRRLSEIPLPDDPAIGLKFNMCYLVVMGGCLSLCLVEEGYGTAMWTMKEYKVQSSWIKSFVLSSNCHPLLPLFFPICSTKNGDILGSNGNTLVRLNNKGDLLEHHAPGGQKMDRSGLIHCGVYRESLLSLPPQICENN